MGDHPPRPPSHRSLGGPLPHQPANGTHAHPFPPELYPPPHAGLRVHGVLIRLSAGYPPGMGRLHTRYAPVRRSPPGIATCAAPRLACVRPAASVHPEPGSNSPLYRRSLKLFFFSRPGSFCAIFPKKIYPRLPSRRTLAFLSCFFSVPSRQRTRGLLVRLYRSPPASAGGVYYLVSFSSPIPSNRERKGSNFLIPSNFSAKKNFLFFSPFNTFRTSLLLQSGCKYRTSFFTMQEIGRAHV